MAQGFAAGSVIGGVSSYVAQGLRGDGLPCPGLGYVYVPALILVAATSMLAAPLGAGLW